MNGTPKQHRFWLIGGGIVGVLAVLAILIAANVLISPLSLRHDLTQDKIYTLSPGTRSVLKGLKNPVTLQFFFNGSERGLPGPLKNFAAQVRDLLREYVRAGGGNVTLETYDPQPDSDAESLAESQGVSGQTMNLEGTLLYLGVAAVCGDRHGALPVIDPREESRLEYQLTRLILSVAEAEKPVLGVMSSLPVLGGAPAMPYGPPQPNQEPPWASFAELKDSYTLRTVPPTTDEIDPDIKTLIVVHPKDLADKTLYAIDQFVLRGGRLIAFVDPLCGADPGSGNMPEGMAMFGGGGSKSSTLGKLFPAWGVTFATDKIAADLDAATPVRSRDRRIVESPYFLTLRSGNFNPKEIATAGLENVLFVNAGAFTVDEKKGITATPLIHTSTRTALQEAMMAQLDPEGGRRNFRSDGQAHWLAVRLDGRFTTAFPEGKPAAAGENGSATNAPTPGGLTESATNTTIVLVGDVDALNNAYTVQEMNFFGASAFQPMNDNLAFVANLVDQVTGGPALIAIRSRGQTQRPFTRVLDIQHAAAEQYVDQERTLQEKLQATEQRLRELQTKKDEKQRLMLSPEQQKEVDGFRAEVAQYRKQLREVRKNLREEIEALGLKLKLLNILLMPALVAAAGVTVFWVRRSRARG